MMHNERQNRLKRIIETLDRLYPKAEPALDYSNPFELLIATVLSAQCTDARVNQVTPALFARFPSSNEMAAAPAEELERLLYSTGFYRNKAKNIKALSKMLAEEWNGKVPETMEELTRLPGVGRKTAGVVLSVFFDTPAIIVDTHFARVSRRLGLTESKNPDIIERDIAKITLKDGQTKVSYLLNQHGRNVCYARNPDCNGCPIKGLCPSAKSKEQRILM